ncbi:MAG: hypothetical protein ABSE73_25590, partial [Planctomycetota bacterium]
ARGAGKAGLPPAPAAAAPAATPAPPGALVAANAPTPEARSKSPGERRATMPSDGAADKAEAVNKSLGEPKERKSKSQRSESGDLLVFRTQDPERLISQLRALAAQNGARWEPHPNLPIGGGQVVETVQPANEASQLQADALGKDQQARPRDYLITARPGQQHLVLLAKLLELQADEQSQTMRARLAEQQTPPASARFSKQEAESPGAPTAGKPAAPPVAQTGQPQTMSKTKPQEAAPSGLGAGQQDAEGRGVQIQIRIEVVPAK